MSGATRRASIAGARHAGRPPARSGPSRSGRRDRPAHAAEVVTEPALPPEAAGLSPFPRMHSTAQEDTSMDGTKVFGFYVGVAADEGLSAIATLRVPLRGHDGPELLSRR